MINPISSVTGFTPNINFRSNEGLGGLNFQPKLKAPLMIDVFEKTTSGVNGSKDSISKVNELIPIAKLKQFSPSQREVERNKRIDKEKDHITGVVTKRTEYNTRQLRAAGVPEREVKRYLKIDGHVTDEGKRILREKGKSYQ